ncbi:hypothetical protein EV361DRAFT_110520 [Lentinula raphanica]|nr:hypothetical protein EV361DRAFT_110520 [Lentinula raphanica]
MTEKLESLLFFFLRPLLMCNRSGNISAPKISAESMSNDEIEEAYHSQPVRLDADLVPHEVFKGYVTLVASDTVTKTLTTRSDYELASMEFVRLSTSIPVPKGIRYLSIKDSGYLFAQQYIPGKRLSLLWPTMSWWQRFRVALTLRYYIHQLRTLSYRVGAPSFPGPISMKSQEPQTCHGRLFCESGGGGPFKSYYEMSRWYQNRLIVMQRFGRANAGVAQFDDTEPLVFTHFDLHLANAILGDDGQLWLIDWAEAGWYPRWFESASMRKFAEMAEQPWLPWVSFICGSCEKPGQYPFIRAIGYSLDVLAPEIMNLIDNDMAVFSVSHENA